MATTVKETNCFIAIMQLINTAYQNYPWKNSWIKQIKTSQKKVVKCIFYPIAKYPDPAIKDKMQTCSNHFFLWIFTTIYHIPERVWHAHHVWFFLNFLDGQFYKTFSWNILRGTKVTLWVSSFTYLDGMSAWSLKQKIAIYFFLGKYFVSPSLSATRACTVDWDFQVLHIIFCSIFCFAVIFYAPINMLISELVG